MRRTRDEVAPNVAKLVRKLKKCRGECFQSRRGEGWCHEPLLAPVDIPLGDQDPYSKQRIEAISEEPGFGIVVRA